MSAKTMASLTDNALLKAVVNPLTRDEALAEIDRRNAVQVALDKATIAEARKALEAFTFASLSLDELALVVRLLKPQAVNAGIIAGENVPDSYTQVREAIKAILKAEGIKVDWAKPIN